jgi:hypothetical protein
MCEALSSNPSTEREREREKRGMPKVKKSQHWTHPGEKFNRNTGISKYF